MLICASIFYSPNVNIQKDEAKKRYRSFDRPIRLRDARRNVKGEAAGEGAGEGEDEGGEEVRYSEERGR